MESAALATYDTRFSNATEERMMVPRRRFPYLAAIAAALLAVSPIANAQGYPSRTVRIVVGFPPGQAIDISARLMAEWLQQRLGQTFIVENRPGAAANVATEMVARSPADGYTLLVISSNNVINTTLYGTVDFAREIAPIATFGRGYQVLNVNNSLPVKTVPDLIALAKADPGEAQHGVTGNWKCRPCRRRDVQDDGRGQPRTCALSRLGACTHRHDRRSGPRHVRRFDELDRAHSIGRFARACGDDRDALPSAAGPSHRGRFFAGL